MRTKQKYIGTVTNSHGTETIAVSTIKWIVIHKLKKAAKGNGSNFGKDFWKDMCDWDNRTTFIDKSRAYRYDLSKAPLLKGKEVSTMKTMNKEEYLQKINSVPRELKANYMYKHGFLKYEKIATTSSFVKDIFSYYDDNLLRFALYAKRSILTLNNNYVRYEYPIMNDPWYTDDFKEGYKISDLITDGEIMDYFNGLPEDQREDTVKTLLAHKLTGDNFLHD